MSSELTSNVTWQKVTVIITVMIIVVPGFFRFAWQVVFPTDYLLYETLSETRGENFLVSGIAISNAGSAPQKDVFLLIPASALDQKNTKIEVTPPKKAFLRNYFETSPSIPISKYSQDAGFKVPLGNIDSEEEVRVTIISTRDNDHSLTMLSLHDIRVESTSMIAIEANGMRYPRHGNDIHSIYMTLSPYLLGFLLTLIVTFSLVGMIHEMFFDSYQKKMSRLWRQMDELQEKFDKERRYQ